MKGKTNRHKARKSPLSERVGGKIGRTVGTVIKKAYSHKAVRIATIVILLAVLFLFIAPIQKNLVTVGLLAILAVVYLIVSIKEKKK